MVNAAINITASESANAISRVTFEPSSEKERPSPSGETESDTYLQINMTARFKTSVTKVGTAEHHADYRSRAAHRFYKRETRQAASCFRRPRRRRSARSFHRKLNGTHGGSVRRVSYVEPERKNEGKTLIERAHTNPAKLLSDAATRLSVFLSGHARNSGKNECNPHGGSSKERKKRFCAKGNEYGESGRALPPHSLRFPDDR